MKHWIIAASQGDDDSIKTLMDAYKLGFVSKEDLAAALRAHQAAVDETKSPQRQPKKMIEIIDKRWKYLTDPNVHVKENASR